MVERHQYAIKRNNSVVNGRSGRAHIFKAWGEIIVNQLVELGDNWTAGFDSVAQFRSRIVHLRKFLTRVLHLGIHTPQTVVHDHKCVRHCRGNIGHGAVCGCVDEPYSHQHPHVENEPHHDDEHEHRDQNPRRDMEPTLACFGWL